MNTRSISVVLFILLFLVGGVLFYAVSKGGLDIRSRASGTQSCITLNTPTCPAGYTKVPTSDVYAGSKCCKNTPSPTPRCAKEGEGVSDGMTCCTGLELKQVIKGTEQTCVKKGCVIEGNAIFNNECCYPLQIKKNAFGKICRSVGFVPPTSTSTPTSTPTKAPCGQNGQACCISGGSQCYMGLHCVNNRCIVNTPTPTRKPTGTPIKTPTPTVTARCCPKVNTTYAKNTCYGASQAACTTNATYCAWTYSAYCPF